MNASPNASGVTRPLVRLPGLFGVFGFLGLVGLLSLFGVVGCAHRPIDRLEYHSLESDAEQRTMRYGLYLPADWDRSTPLPLVVLLHGASDDETALDRKSVISRLDEGIASGALPPFAMVAPNGERGFWVNWHDGSHRYRDWVMNEVVPEVRSKFAIAPGRENLHLMGVSMGGGGGMQMWLADRSNFSSATIISAPILSESETRDFLERFTSREVMERIFGPEEVENGIDPFAALSSPSDLMNNGLIIGAARHDLGQILQSNERFHHHLVEHRVPHRFITFSGFHRWSSWAPMFVYSLCHQLQTGCEMPAPDGWTVLEGG